MRRLASIMLAATLGAQGCIIYTEICEGCDWREGRTGDDPVFGDDSGFDEDSDLDSSEIPEEEPIVYSAAFVPSQAEQGETFVGRLYLEGPIAYDEIASVSFSGGIRVAFTEAREDALVVLVDVSHEVQPGLAELVVLRDDGTTIVFSDMLRVGEPGSGLSAYDCQ
jgi:hypothetical protein